MTFTIVSFCLTAAPKAFRDISLKILKLAPLWKSEKGLKNGSKKKMESQWLIEHPQSLAIRAKYHEVDETTFGLTGIALITRPTTTITASRSEHCLESQHLANTGILRTTHVEIKEELHTLNNSDVDESGPVHPPAVFFSIAKSL